MNLISFYEHVRCGLWASSGPFPLSAHYGLSKRGRDPPTNPSRHLKKERSALPLKWLLKEGRGRSPTATAAATTSATPCPGHGFFSLSSRRRRPPAAAAASGPPCRHPLRLHPPFALLPAASSLQFLHRLPPPALPHLPISGDLPPGLPFSSSSSSGSSNFPRDSPHSPPHPQTSPSCAHSRFLHRLPLRQTSVRLLFSPIPLSLSPGISVTPHHRNFLPTTIPFPLPAVKTSLNPNSTSPKSRSPTPPHCRNYTTSPIRNLFPRPDHFVIPHSSRLLPDFPYTRGALPHPESSFRLFPASPPLSSPNLPS